MLGQLGIKNVQITGGPSYFESGKTRTIVKRPWDPEGVVTTGYYFNVNLPDSVHVLQDEAYFMDVLFLRGEEDPSDTNPLARPFNEYDLKTSLCLHLKAGKGCSGSSRISGSGNAFTKTNSGASQSALGSTRPYSPAIEESRQLSQI